ncbi:hypothetical protein KC19_4G168300 [Ceratodon purpureus]|uniref:LysM domain-containing protein n=1 Tax=Ceratodon purpureus TaxID=3225 RepID=A0A8T0IBQ3_CERPU|nr:hypothetical protein KC19_4G168300 [Ceratodon purpureus]
MELTVGSVSLSASINETLNSRRSADTSLAQVCRVTPVSRVSVFGRRPVVSAEHSPFSRGGRSSRNWSFAEDITGLGCRLCIKGQKQSGTSHNSRWQASAVAEFSGTDTQDSGISARDDLSNADAAVHIIEEGETLTSIAKRYKTTVSRLASANEIEDVDVLQTGEELVIPFRAAGVRKVSSRLKSESPVVLNTARTKAYAKNARGLRTATTSGYDTPSTLSHVGEHSPFPVRTLAQVVIPLLLIAPIVGFCVRCAVDYIQERIHKEVRARQAELEIYYSRHRPRVNRWQGILDEDREEAADYTEAAAASDTLDDYRFRDERQIPTGYASIRAMSEESIANESDEERSSRQTQDYEEIRKSYAELESTYMKFLSDSGLSRSGYWRGSVTQLQEEI